MKDGCFCLVFEFINSLKNKFIKPFKFKSRIMWRVGIGYFGITVLKMSLYDYDLEAQGKDTEWKK